MVWQDLQRRFFWERQEMKTLKQRKCLKHNNAVLTVFKISFSSPFLYEHVITNVADVSWSLGLRACHLFHSELLGSGWIAEPGKKGKIDCACRFGVKVSLWPSWCFSWAAWFLSNKEGKFNSEALRLIEGIERKRPISAVTQLRVTSARIFKCGWITLGALLQWRRLSLCFKS